MTVIRAQYPNWKFAAFSVADARKAGYILMRDPNDSTHILYDKTILTGEQAQALHEAGERQPDFLTQMQGSYTLISAGL